jgi:transposase
MLVLTPGGQIEDRGRGAEEQLRGRIAALEAESAFCATQNRQLWALVQEGAQARLALEGVLLERDRLAAEIQALAPEHRRLVAENASLAADNARLQDEIARLSDLVETLSRAAHRQSAPFSRNNRTPHPRRSGRRAGLRYGTRAHRRIPEHVHEDVFVPHPRFCPDCGDELVADGEDYVYEQEIPPVAVRNVRYRMCRGRCRRCHKVSRGRHPAQSSVAFGAAACHLGPRAVALAVVLNKECGVSATKIARLFGLFGLSITPGGVVGVLDRAARAAGPTYAALVEGVRNSAVVSPDETGWRVGGRNAWLWAFVGEGVCVYLIAAGRGFAQAAVVLGPDYDGVLVRDGWISYTKFALAMAQTCVGHLLRRAHHMIEAGADDPAGVPVQVRSLLKDALALRDARTTGGLAPDDYVSGIESLNTRRDELLALEPPDAAEARFLRHLRREADALFAFLGLPAVAATNHAAERAIRPAVVNRKSWGGNMTWRGAATQQVLASLCRTTRMQERDPVELIASLLVSPHPVVADLAIPSPRPRRLALPAARSP